MKLTTLTLVALVAFPMAAFAEDSGPVLPKAAEPTPSSSRLPPSPGVTENASGQQRLTNGSPGDAGNTGSDNGMEASDEKVKSTPLHTGQNSDSKTPSNVGPREPGDITGRTTTGAGGGGSLNAGSSTMTDPKGQTNAKTQPSNTGGVDD